MAAQFLVTIDPPHFTIGRVATAASPASPAVHRTASGWPPLERTHRQPGVRATWRVVEDRLTLEWSSPA